MGIYEYTFLSKEEQAELLWDRGLFIDSQQGTACNKALYHLGTFYVQLTIDKFTNEIIEINAYQSPVKLETVERSPMVMN
jgi:hypothetical protein